MKMSKKVCCGICLIIAVLVLYCIFMPEHSMWLRDAVMSVFNHIKDFFVNLYNKIRGIFGS